MPQATMNIFISYGRKDAFDIAVRLRDDLIAQGYSVWLDTNDIMGGADWSQDIEVAIEACHVLLALMSHSAYESQWCRAEQLRALRKGKRIVPLLLEGEAERPLHLEHLNHLDFSNAQTYDEAFRDLLSDLRAGQAFQVPTTTQSSSASPYKPTRNVTRASYRDEKRNAPAFRRNIRALRAEKWLGTRLWWTYFLFYFTDLQHTAEILRDDSLTSAFMRGEALNNRWDKFVRLYFRPRTPDLYHAEGFRPAGEVPRRYTPIPVYLLFDMESIIAHPESRFSDGDILTTAQTYKTPNAFKELPFEQIYHDGGFMPDERDEIMSARQAQVFIPDQISLESLQLIWLRSDAEYDTLRHQLPADVWHRWRDKITTRTDQHLFHHTRPYVQRASLLPDAVHLYLNPCTDEVACRPFDLHATLTYDDGRELEWQATDADLTLTKKSAPPPHYVWQLPATKQGYHLRLTINDELAYTGRYTPDDGVY